MKAAAMGRMALLNLQCEKFFEEMICLRPEDVNSSGCCFLRVFTVNNGGF